MTSLTPPQCRAARALLGISQEVLASKAKVAAATLANFEAESRTPYASTIQKLRGALEKAGVIFIAENGEGPGVRLKKFRKRGKK